MVYLICKGLPWQELGDLSWFLSNRRIFEWWRMGPARSSSSCFRPGGPLRSRLGKGLALGFCCVCLALFLVLTFTGWDSSRMFRTSWCCRKHIYLWTIAFGAHSSTVAGCPGVTNPCLKMRKLFCILPWFFRGKQSVNGRATTKSFSSLSWGGLTIQRERHWCTKSCFHKQCLALSRASEASHGWTDGWMDGQTDGVSSGSQKVGVFLLYNSGTHHSALTYPLNKYCWMNNPLMLAYTFAPTQARVCKEGNFLSFKEWRDWEIQCECNYYCLWTHIIPHPAM